MSRPRQTIVIVCWLIDCGRAGLVKNELHWTSGIKRLPRPMNYANGFNHDPEKFPEFSRRYMKELDNNPAAAEAKNNWNEQSAVTLLYGAKDVEHNQAIVLKKWLED